MVLFRRDSARVSARYLANGVLEVRYAGIICESSIGEISAAVRRATLGAPCLLVRMDFVVLVMNRVPPPVDVAPAYGSYPPCAFVVADAQRQILADYCREAGKFGLMRVVFSTSQLGLAHRWCEFACRLERAKLPPTRHYGLLPAL